MSKEKWSDGPWKVRQGEDTNWWFVIEDSEGRELGSGDGGFEEHEAHLIASAPELYWLLLEARANIDQSYAVSLCADIDKLLAKARGGV